MKIAFLCKRQYMSKDVILDKYARLYEIPNQLALLGHELQCFCLSYQAHGDGTWHESSTQKKLIWHSKSYIGLNKIAICTYPMYLLAQLREYQPDLIIAASDIPHIVIGAWCAKKLHIPFVADLYDNFESYRQAKIPFFKHLFHQALDSAKMISTTSHALAAKIQNQHPNVPHIFAMPSVIDKDIFFPGEQLRARQALNLPLNMKLIGTAGGLTKMKGIDDLFHAWGILKKQREDVCLVLAGPTEQSTPLPNDDRVFYLGLLAHTQVNQLFQALDIGILCIPDDDFGRYCFPQKAYEMLATGLTIISSAVGDMTDLVAKQNLYPAAQPEFLVNAILLQLTERKKEKLDIPDWTDTLKKFNEMILMIQT